MTEASYQHFLDTRLGGRTADLPAVYHAVRTIPYGSVGERDPEKVIANNVGSCSGKHILLRDLIRETGGEAHVITMFTYFNRAVPSDSSMPQELRDLIDGEDVCDFHQYVLARGERGLVKLDATWHDALAPYGFPVNSGWDGAGDTVLAATAIREYGPAENLAAWKAELLNELTPEQRDLRARFFQLLGDWMRTL